MPTQPQLARLFALARNAGLSADEVKQIVAERYGHASRKDLSDREYEELCIHLQEAGGSRAAASGRLKAGELANEMEIRAFLQSEGLPWSFPTELDLSHAVTILDDFRRYRASYKRLSIRDARRCLSTWGRYPLWVWRRSAEIWLSHYRTKNERYFAGILKHVVRDAARDAAA